MTIDYTQLGAGQQWIPLLSSAARTATPNQKQISAEGADVDALIVILNVTAVTATGTLTVKIEGVDPQSNAPWTILQGVAVSATGTYLYKVHPNLPAAANQVAQDIVPTRLRFTVTHGNAVSMTYSLTAEFPD